MIALSWDYAPIYLGILLLILAAALGREAWKEHQHQRRWDARAEAWERQLRNYSYPRGNVDVIKPRKESDVELD